MALEILSIREDGNRGGYPYYAIALYEARPRQLDGQYTWRLSRNIEHWGRATVGVKRRIAVLAHAMQLPYANVGHGSTYGLEEADWGIHA